MHLSKPTDCVTQRVNTDVNYGLCLITMRPCWFADRNKRKSQMEDVDGGRSCVCGEGTCGNSLCFSLSFAVNLKLL